ncbi:hypothetical protein [Flavobacterium filum]|uniref:hypothetical protein n=1 Tax=Flavobacterium filum TaxID=370974 RepID=UPI0023F1DEA8|nr:hypothetical protein [Flavobacterium filum]
MGLDSVEILVEVEKTLGIGISDAEASQISTVGDFHESAWKHVQNKRPLADRCFSQMTFYKLRQKFAETINTDKAAFRPDQQIETIFPKENRRILWSNLQNSADLKMPDLELISPFNGILITFGLLSTLGALAVSIILMTAFDKSALVLLFPIVGGILTYVFSSLLNPLRLKFADETIRQLTEKTLAMNFAKITADKGISKRDVELVINQIISDKAGIDLKEITSDKTIHKDLGID